VGRARLGRARRGGALGQETQPHALAWVRAGGRPREGAGRLGAWARRRVGWPPRWLAAAQGLSGTLARATWRARLGKGNDELRRVARRARPQSTEDLAGASLAMATMLQHGRAPRGGPEVGYARRGEKRGGEGTAARGGRGKDRRRRVGEEEGSRTW
jgi:hypothetical protein